MTVDDHTQDNPKVAHSATEKPATGGLGDVFEAFFANELPTQESEPLRIAADWLIHKFGSAMTRPVDALRGEADLRDATKAKADKIGKELMTAAAQECGPRKLGALAQRLVSGNSKTPEAS